MVTAQRFRRPRDFRGFPHHIIQVALGALRLLGTHQRPDSVSKLLNCRSSCSPLLRIEQRLNRGLRRAQRVPHPRTCEHRQRWVPVPQRLAQPRPLFAEGTPICRSPRRPASARPRACARHRRPEPPARPLRRLGIAHERVGARLRVRDDARRFFLGRLHDRPIDRAAHLVDIGGLIGVDPQRTSLVPSSISGLYPRCCSR